MRNLVLLYSFTLTVYLNGQELDQLRNMQGDLFNRFYFTMMLAEHHFYADTSLSQKQTQLQIYEIGFKEINGFTFYIEHALKTAIEIKDVTRIKKYLKDLFSQGGTLEQYITKKVSECLSKDDVNSLSNDYKSIRSAYLKRPDNKEINTYIRGLNNKDSSGFMAVLKRIRVQGYSTRFDSIILCNIKRQNKYFPELMNYLDKALKNMKISNMDYSVLVDKMLINMGEKTKYGTLLTREEVKKLPVNSINLINKNRNEISLMDLKTTLRL